MHYAFQLPTYKRNDEVRKENCYTERHIHTIGVNTERFVLKNKIVNVHLIRCNYEGWWVAQIHYEGLVDTSSGYIGPSSINTHPHACNRKEENNTSFEDSCGSFKHARTLSMKSTSSRVILRVKLGHSASSEITSY